MIALLVRRFEPQIDEALSIAKQSPRRRDCHTATVPKDQLNGSPVRRATIRLNLPTIA